MFQKISLFIILTKPIFAENSASESIKAGSKSPVCLNKLNLLCSVMEGKTNDPILINNKCPELGDLQIQHQKS